MADLLAEIQMRAAELRRRKDVPQGVIDAFDEMAKIDPGAPETEKRAQMDALTAEIVRLMRLRGAN